MLHFEQFHCIFHVYKVIIVLEHFLDMIIDKFEGSIEGLDSFCWFQFLIVGAEQYFIDLLLQVYTSSIEEKMRLTFQM